MSTGGEWYLNTGKSGTAAGRLSRLIRLIFQPADLWLFLRILFWAVSLSIMRPLLPLSVLARWMWKKTAARPAADSRRKTIVFTDWIYSFLYAKTNCLERSLLLYRLLSADGLDPRLVSGLRQRGPSTEGHAWIELEGCPIGEQENVGEYVRLCEFGPDGKIQKVPQSNCS